MRESTIQNRHVYRLRKIGAHCIKLTGSGDPDYLVLFGARMFFIEYKAPGEKPKRHQSRRHKKLRDMGFNVSVVDSYESAEAWTNRHLL